MISLNRFTNMFMSDPRYMGSYFEAQFRQREARSNEVILLVPNILNPCETLPVPVTYDQLFHFYMDIYERAFPEGDEGADQQLQTGQLTREEKLYVIIQISLTF